MTGEWGFRQGGHHEVVSGADCHGEPLRIVIDMDTGLVRVDQMPGQGGLAWVVEGDRTPRNAFERPGKRQVLQNFRRTEDYVGEFADILMPARSVLEVGAGSGEFAFIMASLGKKVTGIEPDTGKAAYAREALGLDVRTTNLAHDLFEPGSFDLVRLNDVLGRMNDPVGCLDMIGQWLAPGGVIYVEVPNIEVRAREMPRGALFQDGSIFGFNPWTLRTAAALAGLDEVPATIARTADTTGIFVRQTDRAIQNIMVTDRENAEHVRDLIARHDAGDFRKSGVGRPLATLWNRIGETVSGWLAGSPRRIGERIAQRLMATVEA